MSLEGHPWGTSTWAFPMVLSGSQILPALTPRNMPEMHPPPRACGRGHGTGSGPRLGSRSELCPFRVEGPAPAGRGRSFPLAGGLAASEAEAACSLSPQVCDLWQMGTCGDVLGKDRWVPQPLDKLQVPGGGKPAGPLTSGSFEGSAMLWSK